MRFKRIFFLILIGLIGVELSAGGKSETQSSKKILVLVSYHMTHPWSSELTQSIIAGTADFPERLDFNVVELDAIRIKDSAAWEREIKLQLDNIVSGKYQMIVAIDDISLEYLLKYADKLPPDLPIVFAGCENYTSDLKKIHPNLTGVKQNFNTAATIETALKLYPDTKTVAIFYDSSNDSVRFAETHKKQLKKLPGIEYRYIGDTERNIQKAIREIKELPQNSIVIVSPCRGLDNNGYQSVGALAADLDTVCRRPYFISENSMFGYGSLGGFITVAGEHGQAVADLIKQVFRAGSAENVSIEDGRVLPIFDYNVIIENDLDFKALPAESIILNQPHGIWENHRMVVIFVASIMTLLLFISGLLTVSFIINRKIMRQSRKFLNGLPGRIGVLNQNEDILYINAISVAETGLIDAKKLCDIPNVDYEKISAAVAKVFASGERMVLEYDYNSVQRFMTIAPLDKQFFKQKAIVWFSHDNSELQQARRQAENYAAMLKKNTRMWDILINSLPIQIFAKDADNNFSYVFNNRTRAEFYGAAVDELNGKNDFDFIPGKIAKMLRDNDEKCMKHLDKSEESFLELQNAAGAKRKMRAIQVPFVDEDGTRLLLGAMLDMTEIEESHRILAEEKELRDTMIEFMPFIFFAKDIDDNCRYVMGNDALAKFTGKPLSVLKGHTDADLLFSPEENSKIMEIDKKIVEEGKYMEFEEDLTGDDGKIHHMLTCKKIFRGSNGRNLLLGVSSDITDLVGLKNQAEENAEWLRLTLNSIGDGVITTDEVGKIVMMNPVAERMIGVRQEDAVGKPHESVFKIVGAYDNEPIASPVRRTLRTGSIVELANHTDLISADGRRYHIADSAAPISDHNNKVIGAILVFRDVTEEYESRDTLRSAITSLEYASELTNSAAFKFDINTKKITGSKILSQLWPIDKNGVAMNMRDFVCAEDWPEMDKNWQLLLKGEKESSVVNYRVEKDGSFRYYRLKASADRSNPANIIFYGVIQDITEITESTFRLKYTIDLWEQVVNTLPIMFFVKSVDEEFCYLLANHEFAMFHGRNREDFPGKTDKDLGLVEAEILHQDDLTVAKSDEVCTFSRRILDSEGVPHLLETFKKIFVGADGKRLLFGATRDISELDNVIKNEKAVSQSLSHVILEPTFDGALRRIAENLSNLLGCDRIVLTKCNSEHLFRFYSEWHAEYLSDVTAIKLSWHEQVWDENAAQLKENKIIKFSDLGKSKFNCESAFIDENYTLPQSLIVSPIFIDNELWGALLVSFSKEKRNFSVADEKLMRSMCDIVAIAKIRERQQHEIKRSNLEKQLILDNINIPVWLHDGSGNLLQANATVSQLAGIPLNELDTEKNWNIFGEEFPDNEVRPIPEVIRTRRAVQQNITFKGKDYITATRPIIDEKGEISYIIKSAIEVTELNNMIKNQQLINFCLETFFAESNIKKAFEQVCEAICRHLHASQCFVIRFDEETNMATTLCEYVAPGNSVIFEGIKNFNYHSEQPWHQAFGRHELLSKVDTAADGEEKFFGDWFGIISKVKSLYANGIYMNGKFWGNIGIAYEKNYCKLSDAEQQLVRTAGRMVELLLERENAQQQILNALTRAQDADKAKSFFIASVSHEIRTPLNAVIGFAELLKGGGVSPNEQKEYLENIAYSGNALLQLINDVLDLSKLESDQMRLINEPTDFAALGQEVMSVFTHSAAEKNIQLLNRIPDMPILELDKLRIRQILFNLIGNAVKFTKAGTVTLQAEFIPESDGFGIFKFGVADTGIGIESKDQKKLMEPFVQLSQLRGTNASQNGTGLGLSICKRLAEKMNGGLELISSIGKGSMFEVTLPHVKFNRSEHVEQSIMNYSIDNLSNIPASTTLLLVDDVELNLKVIQAICLKIGFKQVICANSGKAALELLAQRKIDLVLTDVWMPDMNGADLAAEIHKNPDLANLPIIAVTADIEVNGNFSMDNFVGILLKPVTLNKTHRMIEYALNPSSAKK